MRKYAQVVTSDCENNLLQIKSQQNLSTDHSPFRQTFELVIFISTARKSILNLVMW